MDPIALTRTLIDMPSITGHETRIGDFLMGYLRAAGFDVQRQPVDADRFNVIAAVGTPQVVLSTHMDTVPPFFPSWEDDDFIGGRGACDAKGVMAAQIAAAVQLMQEGVTDFGLLFVVGEERGSDGAKAANGWPNACRFLINGEPTDNCLATGTKGVFRGEIRVKGRAAHAAYPEAGESAIFKLMDILNDLRSHAWPDDPVLGHTVFGVGTITGGTTANVVPDFAWAEVMFRTVLSVEAMRGQIDALVSGRAEVTPLYTCEPIHLLTLDGFETKPVGFATDIVSLDRWGQPLLLGPGSILDAHTEGERIRKADLLHAVTLYQRLIQSLKARP